MAMTPSKSPASSGHSDLSSGPADFLLSELPPMVMAPLPVQLAQQGADTSDRTRER